LGVGDGLDFCAGSDCDSRVGLGVGEVVNDGDGDADAISACGVFLLGQKSNMSDPSEIRAAITASAIALFEIYGVGDFSMWCLPLGYSACNSSVCGMGFSRLWLKP
jgi:hypothetical protein